MKKIYLLLLILPYAMIAQNTNSSVFESIVKAERRAGSARMLMARNINTGNYDLKYHRLEWTVDPSITPATITGAVTSYFVAKQDLSTITFDMAANLNVVSVKQRGVNLAYTHLSGSEELVITLPATQTMGILDSLEVSYNGNPTSNGFGSYEVNTHGTTQHPILWTLSEPYGAMGWWPCKQDLNDKIDSIDVFITHPTAYLAGDGWMMYKAASNGLLQSETTSGTNTITHWKHNYPIPAYLIAMAVTDYTVYNDYVANGDFDVVNYVYPENATTAQTQTPVTVDLINLYGSLFEMYPFANEKYGHAQFGWGGGMEHTTMTFMNNFSRDLIAHELAHQWFGDKVTCGSWQDIWLNEGFATFLTGLSKEHLDGIAAYKTWRQGKVNHITGATNGSVYLPAADTTNINRIFSSRLSYNKGSMVLHMLRWKLGDNDFFQGVKNYLADTNLAYGYAKTPDFQTHLETQSGENLTDFFQDWIYNEGYPTYTINWQSLAGGTQVQLQINQTQSNASVTYFEMPLELELQGAGGQTQLVRVEHTTEGQIFTLATDFEVTNVAFDPNYQIISKNNQTVLATDLILDETSIQIYPNPSKTSINITYDASLNVQHISVYNALGQQVYTKDDLVNTIAISTWSKGFYFIKIKTAKGSFTKKLLKQ
jgi:aminopeptidase N